MSKQNFKSQAKRKRELAKLDKRTAKDQKRAAKKAENSVDVVTTLATAVPVVAAPKAPFPGMRPTAVVPPKVPLTLAEMAQRWKNTKIVKPKIR